MNSKGKGIITAVIVVLIALAAFCGFGYISQRMTASEGITYLDKKEYQKAYEQFDHAAGKFTLIFTKQKKDVLFYEGEALYQMGEYGKAIEIYDELIGESKETKDADRFAEVERIEAMSPEEKFAFWQSELSKCIRCNACRNVCPACSCRKCVFDSNKFDSAQKANVDSFEEKMFHVIRAFHVAGRCTDCGECSRVCPQGIPLHLFNRKFIKDIDAFYGEYQAGEDAESKGPLTSFTFDDVEPGIVAERG